MASKAYRPSESHRQYVTNAKGEKVLNGAWKPNERRGSSRGTASRESVMGSFTRQPERKELGIQSDVSPAVYSRVPALHSAIMDYENPVGPVQGPYSRETVLKNECDAISNDIVKMIGYTGGGSGWGNSVKASPEYAAKRSAVSQQLREELVSNGSDNANVAIDNAVSKAYELFS